MNSLFGINKKEILGILDLGSETIKLLVLREERDLNRGKFIILAKVRGEYERFGLFNGREFFGDVLKKSIQELIEEAERRTKTKIKKVALGLPPSILKARVYFQELEREKPEKKIDKKENKEIFDIITRQITKQAETAFEEQLSVPAEEIDCFSKKVSQVKIDGYGVPQILGFSGKKIGFKVLIICAQRNDLEIIQKTVKSLGLDVVRVVHESEGLIRLLDKKKSRGLFLDIGGNYTQLFLAKDGNLEKVSGFKRGGKDFSEILSHSFGIFYHDAVELIKRYQKGVLSQELSDRIKELLKEEAGHWLFLLEDELGKDCFFQKLFLFGGGCNLPEIKEALSKKYDLTPKELELDIFNIKDISKTKDNNYHYAPALLLALAD